MKSTKTKSKPLVTIIMPIRNEAAFIERSLGAVLAQTYPADKMEILIADGMSDDGTLDIIRAVPTTHTVKIIPNPKRRQAAGMNTAIKHANGDIIVRVDGHTIIEPNYIEECVIALKESGADNVGGPMDPVGLTPMGKVIAAAGKSAFAVPTAFHVSEHAQFTDTVYMGAWWKSVFERIGEFDEVMVTNEDYEFNYRIRASGGTIFLSPRMKSHYYGRQSLKALWQQYFRYGIGKVSTLRMHPKSLKLRHVIAPAFVFVLVVGAVGALLHPVLLALWLGVMLAYVMVNLYFSIKVARRAGMALLARIPLVFFVIHLSWGLGFWYALFR